MLDVDLTRAARSHRERLEVVSAIVAAPVNEPETDWVEWKSALDVSQAAGAFVAARSILGFGNRDPAHSIRYAHGCAYLIVGATPGVVSAVSAHDPADVEQWLAPYIARGEPQWSIDYVDLEGQTVMFMTVEAPQWGDPIFTLQKGYNQTLPGAIFVRGNGKTDYASPQDIRRLTERAKRANLRLNVCVEWRRPARLVALADFAEQAQAFADREGQRLRLPPERPRGAFDLALPLSGDMRSRDAYRAEVAAYCKQASTRYGWLAEKAVVDGGSASLALEIVNLTDINFPETQVTVRLPIDIRAYFDSAAIDNTLRDLEPPLPWGKKSFLGYEPSVSPVNLSAILRPDGRKIESREELVVTLPPLDVRPGMRHELLPVELVLPSHYAGKAVEIHWHATSTGAAGDADGILEAEVDLVAHVRLEERADG